MTWIKLAQGLIPEVLRSREVLWRQYASLLIAWETTSWEHKNFFATFERFSNFWCFHSYFFYSDMWVLCNSRSNEKCSVCLLTLQQVQSFPSIKVICKKTWRHVSHSLLSTLTWPYFANTMTWQILNTESHLLTNAVLEELKFPPCECILSLILCFAVQQSHMPHGISHIQKSTSWLLCSFHSYTLSCVDSTNCGPIRKLRVWLTDGKVEV